MSMNIGCNRTRHLENRLPENTFGVQTQPFTFWPLWTDDLWGVELIVSDLLWPHVCRRKLKSGKRTERFRDDGGRGRPRPSQYYIMVRMTAADESSM